MMNVGEIATCTITDVGAWGAYASSIDGDSVFINFGELSWSRLRTASDLVRPGDQVNVLILRAPLPIHPYFLGSIKRTVSNSALAGVQDHFPAGSRVSGRVVLRKPFGVFVELAEGVVGLVKIPNANLGGKGSDTLPHVGETLVCEVIEVESINGHPKISLRIIAGETNFDSSARETQARVSPPRMDDVDPKQPDPVQTMTPNSPDDQSQRKN